MRGWRSKRDTFFAGTTRGPSRRVAMGYFDVRIDIQKRGFRGGDEVHLKGSLNVRVATLAV
jgi:hypothetical protein